MLFLMSENCVFGFLHCRPAGMDLLREVSEKIRRESHNFANVVWWETVHSKRASRRQFLPRRLRSRAADRLQTLLGYRRSLESEDRGQESQASFLQ